MRSLEEYVSLQGKRQSGKADSKITVALGTLRTKVTVSESKSKLAYPFAKWLYNRLICFAKCI